MLGKMVNAMRYLRIIIFLGLLIIMVIIIYYQFQSASIIRHRLSESERQYLVAERDCLTIDAGLFDFYFSKGDKFPDFKGSIRDLQNKYNKTVLKDLKDNQIDDPWGNNYIISLRDSCIVEITSMGPDGKPDTSDELVCIFDFRKPEIRVSKPKHVTY